MKKLFSTLAMALLAGAASAQPLPVVASFSILGDVVSQLGGERVAVQVLVGPGSDAHVVQPTPAQARQVALAQVVVAHGMGLEGWLPRLLKSAGFKGRQLLVAEGLKPLKATGPDRHGHAHDIDPHTWQDVASVRHWVPRIAVTLCEADAAGCDTYRARAAAYTQRLDALDAEIRAASLRLEQAKQEAQRLQLAAARQAAQAQTSFAAQTRAEAAAAAAARAARQVLELTTLR